MKAAKSEATMTSNKCERRHPYMLLVTGPEGPDECKASSPRRALMAYGHACYRAGPPTAAAYDRLRRSILQRFYDIHVRSMIWAAGEAAMIRDPDPRCYVTPSYTGGTGRPVAVDGALRQPQCFGTHGEPWAQPLGTRHTAHGFGPDAEVVVERIDSRGFFYRLVTSEAS